MWVNYPCIWATSWSQGVPGAAFGFRAPCWLEVCCSPEETGSQAGDWMGVSLELAESWKEGPYSKTDSLGHGAVKLSDRGLGEVCNRKGDLTGAGSFQRLAGPAWQEPSQAGMGYPAGHLEPSRFFKWKRLRVCFQQSSVPSCIHRTDQSVRHNEAPYHQVTATSSPGVGFGCL